MNVSISCPSCASPVSYATGNKVCRCLSCGTVLKILLTGGIFSYRKEIQESILEKAVKTSLNEFCQNNDYRIIDRDVIFLPIWRAEGRVTGWVSGKVNKKRTPYSVEDGKGNKRVLFRTEGGEVLRRIIDVPLTFFDVDNAFFREYFPSVDLFSGVRGDNLLLFDENKMKDSGKIYFPEKEIEEAKAVFIKKMKETALSYWDAKKFDFFRSVSEVLNFNLTLIFYPVLLVRFVVPKREGFVIIDCTTGKTAGRKMTAVKSGEENFLAKKGFFCLASSVVGYVAGILISRGGFFAGAGIFLALLGAVFLFRKNYGD